MNAKKPNPDLPIIRESLIVLACAVVVLIAGRTMLVHSDQLRQLTPTVWGFEFIFLYDVIGIAFVGFGWWFAVCESIVIFIIGAAHFFSKEVES